MKDYDSEDVILAIAGVYLAFFRAYGPHISALHAIISQPIYVDINFNRVFYAHVRIW